MSVSSVGLKGVSTLGTGQVQAMHHLLSNPRTELSGIRPSAMMLLAGNSC